MEHREAFATAFGGKCIFFHGKLDCNNPGSCPYVHGDLMKPPEMTAFFTERHEKKRIPEEWETSPGQVGSRRASMGLPAADKLLDVAGGSSSEAVLSQRS